MIFELWEETQYESRCVARRNADQVLTEYHDMNVGECRPIVTHTELPVPNRRDDPTDFVIWRTA